MNTSPKHTTFRRALAAASVVTLTGILLAPAGYAQVSKCIDKGGKVVGYASECPSGTRVEQMNIRSAPAAAPATAGKTLAEREADFRKRQMEKQEAQGKTDKQAADNEARARACDSARSYLKTLQSGTRVVRADPTTGERTFLGDDDYPKEMATAQRAVEANCK